MEGKEKWKRGVDDSKWWGEKGLTWERELRRETET